MTKSTFSRALLLAGVMSAAAATGIAQAQTSDVPIKAGEASTMVQGQPNMQSSDGQEFDTRSLGAGPAYTEGYVTSYSSSDYILPAPVAAAPYEQNRGGASETSNVPGRAGEASTMTGGAPNVSTDNMPGHVIRW